MSRAIENAQRKVEGHNFDIRKQLLEYDDVASDQRKVTYQQRSEMMLDEDMSETIEAIREDVVDTLFHNHVPFGSLEEQWDIDGLEKAIAENFDLQLPIADWLEKDDNLNEDSLKQKILDEMVEAYQGKESLVGATELRRFEKYILLQVLDNYWKEHLAAMDYLRQSIHLRGYAQKNPKQEYKRESFEMFSEMLDKIKFEVVGIISKVQIRTEEMDELEQQQHAPADVNYEHAEAGSIGSEPAGESKEKHQPYVRGDKKIGRNDPCYCGSGKKFKQCHGKLA